MKFFQMQLTRGAMTRNVFSAPGEITLVNHGKPTSDMRWIWSADRFMPDSTPSLRVHLCADEVVIVTVDPRTGRLTLRDTGDLAAAGRGPRFATISDRLNDTPWWLPEALLRLRLTVRYAPFTETIQSGANPTVIIDHHRPCGAEGSILGSAELPTAQLCS